VGITVVELALFHTASNLRRRNVTLAASVGIPNTTAGTAD
jgi:hypothetical protein